MKREHMKSTMSTIVVELPNLLAFFVSFREFPVSFESSVDFFLNFLFSCVVWMFPSLPNYVVCCWDLALTGVFLGLTHCQHCVNQSWVERQGEFLVLGSLHLGGIPKS